VSAFVAVAFNQLTAPSSVLWRLPSSLVSNMSQLRGLWSVVGNDEASEPKFLEHPVLPHKTTYH